jgi:hypothetical protein
MSIRSSWAVFRVSTSTPGSQAIKCSRVFVAMWFQAASCSPFRPARPRCVLGQPRAERFKSAHTGLERYVRFGDHLQVVIDEPINPLFGARDVTDVAYPASRQPDDGVCCPLLAARIAAQFRAEGKLRFASLLAGVAGFCSAAFFALTSADFAAAFFAIAVRCSGVMVSSRRLPPFLPSFRRYSDSWSETLSFAMSLA